MIQAPFIDRNLSYTADGVEEVITHRQLLDRPENLVILGEAGMGKSRLLEELAIGGGRRVTARRLINAPDPGELLDGEKRVFVDALDEAPAFAEGGVVDQVLAKLEQSGVGRFLFACRAEDWQAATSRSIIAETFGDPPLELRLKPFDERQMAEFLTAQLGRDRAEEVIETYHKRGLAEWLGNPQTLTMLAAVAEDGELPETTSALFEAYVYLALRDANPVRRQRQVELPKDVALDTLGAAFAALILSGKSALARPGAKFSEDDLRLSELCDLPGFNDWKGVSGNRLVRTYAGDSDRLTYVHRRIGEWLGARWLARYAGSDTVRNRLFASLTVDDIVPASLRGLFAWLSLAPEFSLRVIATDPMAVIEYGDADVLNEKEANALFNALETLSLQNPWFAGWGNFRAKALLHPRLQSKTLEAVFDPSLSDRFRVLLTRQFHGESLRPDVVERLRQLALNGREFYALRDDAAEALVGNLSGSRLRSFVEELRCQSSHDATRLAARMILQSGIDNFHDEQVVETILAACGHTVCAVPAEGEDSMAARAWRYRYEIPDERVEGILDLLADYAVALLPEHRSIESSDIISLGDALVARRLQLGPVQPIALLHWLRAFGGRDSYVADDEKPISTYLREHDEMRQTLQQAWLAGKNDDEEFFKASYRLTEIHPGLAFGDADLAAFLNSAPAEFGAWRSAVRLIPHSATEGAETREACRRFVKTEKEYAAFIEQLLNPPRPDWLAKQEERAASRRAEQEERWADFRRGMAAERDLLEQGRFGIIIQGANAYLGRFSDLYDIKTAEERLAALCGPDLAQSVLRGLEAYLDILPPYPCADHVAEDYARGRAWNARYILLAGLAERVKQTGTIGQLTADQLIAAQLHIAHQSISANEWQPLEEAVWSALIAEPQAFETYARLLVEPSLRRKREIISGLYEILHDGKKAHPELIAHLALDWLQRFPRMATQPETELMDVLIGRREYANLGQLIERRLRMKTLSEERRRNWQAAGLICDFERYAPKLADVAEKDHALFWAIRELLGARRPYDEAPDHTPLRLAAWLVERFRRIFPVQNRPSGVTMGDTNAWDATDAICRLISRVGADVSDEAGDLLVRLAEVEDGYRNRILAVLAEYRRNRAEQARAIVGVSSLAALLSDGPPQSLPDMQARLLDLLDRLEAQAKSNDTDSWVTFFRDDRRTPHGEEYCRDRIIDMLRQHERTIQFSPEKHLGQDREGDIACEYGVLHLPIEVKGQWHPDLWRAADTQLTAQQAIDHRADGYGILLVLWFGDAGKKLKASPRGLSFDTPTTPEGLEGALTSTSKAASEGRVRIKVLDLSRA